MKTEIKREAHHAGTLASFISELGLKQLHWEPHGSCGFTWYDWPATENGTKYDREILIYQFSDKSWTAHLATSSFELENRVSEMRNMVRMTA